MILVVLGSTPCVQHFFFSLSNLHTTLYMTRNMLHRKFLTSQKDISTQASGHVALFHLYHLFIYFHLLDRHVYTCITNYYWLDFDIFFKTLYS